jgi:hypothetical protein
VVASQLDIGATNAARLDSSGQLRLELAAGVDSSENLEHPVLSKCAVAR